MSLLTLTITGDEQPASVSLRTLTRSDTGDTVAGVTLPDDFTGDSGTWTYEFTAPAEGLHYDYTFRMVWDDGTFNEASGALDEAETSDHYASQADLETWQGEYNVAVYSDVSGTNTLDSARVEVALSRADAQINRALRQRGYSAPLDPTSDDYELISHIAARLALYYLYSPRESRDDSEQAGDGGAIIKANTWRRRAIDELNLMLLNGIDGDRHTDAPVVPVAVD